MGALSSLEFLDLFGDRFINNMRVLQPTVATALASRGGYANNAAETR